jgi:hypothetical protein
VEVLDDGDQARCEVPDRAHRQLRLAEEVATEVFSLGRRFAQKIKIRLILVGSISLRNEEVANVSTNLF